MSSQIDPLVERAPPRRRRLAALERAQRRLLPDGREHGAEFDHRITERKADVYVPLYLTRAEAVALADFILEAEHQFLQPSSTEAEADSRDRLAQVAGQALLSYANVIRQVLGLSNDEALDALERLNEGRPIDTQEMAPSTRNE